MMAVVGVSTIIASSTSLFSIEKNLGAVYLVHLGTKLSREKFNVDLRQAQLPVTVPAAFQQAIFVDGFNPTTAKRIAGALPDLGGPLTQ
ncbi:MAG: LysE family transporter [Pseudomonadota bacterium]